MSSNPPEETAEVSSNAESSVTTQDKINWGGITPAVRDRFVVAGIETIVELNLSACASQWVILAVTRPEIKQTYEWTCLRFDAV
jgi:hypothetical protein